MDSQPSSTPNVDRWLRKNLQEDLPPAGRLAAAEQRVDQLEAELAATRQLLFAVFDEAPSRARLFERFCKLCDQARNAPGGVDQFTDTALRDLEQSVATR